LNRTRRYIDIDFYEKLPTDLLMTLYGDMIRIIEKGTITKKLYYELGLIISVASQRGLTLGQPCTFKQKIIR